MASSAAVWDIYTEFNIPDGIVERLRSAGDEAAQKREGLTIFTETAAAVKSIEGVKGIHILSGGKEAMLPEFIALVEQ